jgi:hypothetical protein
VRRPGVVAAAANGEVGMVFIGLVLAR